jgi:hypothetical protein
MPSFRQARKSSAKSSAPRQSNPSPKVLEVPPKVPSAEAPTSISAEVVLTLVHKFYSLNRRIVEDTVDSHDIYVRPIKKIFLTFINGHRNMLQFIRDIYRMPNVEQNGQYLTSVLGLVVFGSNAETYSKIFVESDFYLYCAFVGEMKRRCVGFEDIRNYNQLMNDAKKEVGIATFNAMMAIF